MGKSLIIKGADFHVNGMKTHVWDIDFTGGLSSFSSIFGSFVTATGMSYLPSLFDAQQTVRSIEIGTACTSEIGDNLATAIRVFKINRTTLMATFITQVNYTIPSKASTEKMIIDLGENITLGNDESLAFFGIQQSGSTQDGATLIGYTIDNDLPAETLSFVKSDNLDYSADSFAISFVNAHFKGHLNMRLGI